MLSTAAMSPQKPYRWRAGAVDAVGSVTGACILEDVRCLRKVQINLTGGATVGATVSFQEGGEPFKQRRILHEPPSRPDATGGAPYSKGEHDEPDRAES